MFAPKRVFLTLLLVTLAACGQSGPLYLPGNPSDVQQAPQTSPPADDRAEDEEDNAAP